MKQQQAAIWRRARYSRLGESGRRRGTVLNPYDDIDMVPVEVSATVRTIGVNAPKFESAGNIDVSE
jgi:hypothetical protein